MSVYKIFPEKSSTLYSYYPTLNTGNDEILELSTYYSINSTNEVSRPILKFNQNDLNTVITLISSSNYDAYLKLSLAYATQLPLNYTIYAHPLAKDWNRGTGRAGDSPIISDGNSWQFSDQLSGSAWFSTFPAYTTGSYRSGGVSGGGLWYTSSAYYATQSFTNLSNLDIELKVTGMFSAWSGSVIPNYGVILKHSSSVEFTSASKFETKYFSANTHTIYPPCLELRWDDSLYLAGSYTVNSDLFVVSLGNNKNEYQQDSVQTFTLSARPKFPPRNFNVGSFNYYPTNYVLPSTSYWSIVDYDTKEIIVDYDTTYTKISCNGLNNYFKVYMNGLQPERYYKLLFKTVLSNGETVIFDENYIFKVIR